MSLRLQVASFIMMDSLSQIFGKEKKGCTSPKTLGANSITGIPVNSSPNTSMHNRSVLQSTPGDLITSKKGNADSLVDVAAIVGRLEGTLGSLYSSLERAHAIKGVTESVQALAVTIDKQSALLTSLSDANSLLIKDNIAVKELLGTLTNYLINREEFHERINDLRADLTAQISTLASKVDHFTGFLPTTRTTQHHHPEPLTS